MRSRDNTPSRYIDSYPSGTIEISAPRPAGDYDYDPDLEDWVAVARAKYTLDSAKAMIVAYAEAFENHVSGNVSIGEKLSWTVKEAAATAHLAGTATSRPDRHASGGGQSDR